MDRQIPIVFDTIVLDAPIATISEEVSNAFRLEVAVFTKYRNRNGSYITDEYADLLIKSAIKGNVPVIGFFDPEKQEWASHTGPALANGYGYVENFIGWKPLTDTDGVSRDYAVFSVILFTEYYEEANKIRGQHQSMELNIKTITGDWAKFDDNEYYVYKTGDMLGLCVIGSHEPCFSVSSFFSNQEETYKQQYQEFSLLLSDLRALVEKTKNNQKEGEQPMNEFEEKNVVTPAEEQPQESEEKGAETFEEEKQEEKEEVKEVPEEEEAKEESEPSEFEVLKQQFEELQNSYEELQNSYNELQTKFNEATETFNKQTEELREENTDLKAKIQNYEIIEQQAEETKKNNLINKYENYLTEEEITPIKGQIKDFSYEALESKLAVIYANKQITEEKETKKIPLLPVEENSFATFMKKYKK